MDTDALLGTIIVILIFGGIPMGIVGAVIILLHRHDAGDAGAARAPQTLAQLQRHRPADGQAVSTFRTSRPLGDTTAFLLAVVAGVLTWVAWLSWGNQKDYDPDQIVGCAVTGIVVVVVLGFLTRWWRTGPLSVGLGGLAGFSTAWAVWAGLGDDTGQWGGGYFFLMIGGGMALAVLSLAVVFLRWLPVLRSR
ncbi:MAG: hypothetical protein L0K27_10075 [Corynebacterium nuruki]|nr:hypothetical protein [Corynebacterium nuruki]